MKAAAPEAVHQRHRRSIPEAQIDADPKVVRAQADLEQFERAHSQHGATLARLNKLLPAIDAGEGRARAELVALRDQLPRVCAGVLLGEIPEAEEANLLAAIEEAERIVRRYELGRPSVQARIQSARAGMAPKAAAVERAEEHLEHVREQVRDRLARDLR